VDVERNCRQVIIPLNIERLRGGETLQKQLYRQIRDSILTGTLRPGASLPSSRELAQELGVSRNTAILAYEWLCNEGYLETRHGAGTFVTERLPDVYLASPDPSVVLEQIAAVVKRPRIVFRGERHTMVEKGVSGPIDFWYGSPNWRHFPLKAWRQLLIENLPRSSNNLSRYDSPSGNFELRQAIAEHVGATRGIRATPEQVVITAGAQEGMNLVCRLFVEPGVRVAVEDPCYGGAARIFRSYGAELVPVRVDKQGIDIPRLEPVAAALAYVTPSHQFPTGATLPLERRLRLLQWAQTTGAYVVEDDYDSDFRYDGPPLAALAGLDRNGCVLYMGTFSKSIGAGLRLGFLVIPPHLVDVMMTVKSLATYGHPWLDQIVLAEFIRGGGYRRHLRRIRQLYRRARDTLVRSLEQHFGPQELSGQDAGMHLMWTLPLELSPPAKFAAAAAAEGVGIYTLAAVGAIEFENLYHTRNVVLGYSALSDAQIEVGIRRIARAFQAGSSHSLSTERGNSSGGPGALALLNVAGPIKRKS
jgi:GntR family transcriptional regulator / MocR family aminotransferase